MRLEDMTPEQVRALMLKTARKHAEGPMSGEVSTARYSPFAIAVAGSRGLLRVTPSGLGYIREIEPDLPPHPQPSSANGRAGDSDA